MNSLSYNANVDIPPYHLSERSAMPISYDGSYRPGSMDPMQQMQQMQMQMPMQQMPMQQMPMQQMPMQQMPMQQMPIMSNMMPPMSRQSMQNKNNLTKEKFEPSTKFNWILLAKKIIIYTMLFLIISHVKLNELIFRFVPYFSEHEIPLMIVKGVFISIIIVVLQKVIG